MSAAGPRDPVPDAIVLPREPDCRFRRAHYRYCTGERRRGRRQRAGRRAIHTAAFVASSTTGPMARPPTKAASGCDRRAAELQPATSERDRRRARRLSCAIRAAGLGLGREASRCGKRAEPDKLHSEAAVFHCANSVTSAHVGAGATRRAPPRFPVGDAQVETMNHPGWVMQQDTVDLLSGPTNVPQSAYRQIYDHNQ